MLEKADVRQKKQIKRTIFNENASNENCKEAIDYYYEIMQADIMNENLVDGAWLRCEKATGIDVIIDGHVFHAQNKGYSKLKVECKNTVNGHAKAICYM